MPRVSGWPSSDAHRFLFLKTEAWGHHHRILLCSADVVTWFLFFIISTPCIITKSTSVCSNVLCFLFQQMPCPLSSSGNFLFCNKFQWRNYNRAGPRRAPGHKNLSVSSIACSWPHSASLAFPEFQVTDSDSGWSGKEGDAKTREEQSRKETRDQPWGRILSRRIHKDVGILYT